MTACCGLLRSKKHVNSYVIDRKIGSGAFANIYTVTDKHSDAMYAMKVMPVRQKSSTDYLKIFENEIAILSELQNKDEENRIIELVDTIKDRKRYCIVMTYLKGEELFNIIIQRKRLREFEVALLTKQMLSAIKCVHSCNILHRDIKAENFMFAEKIGERDLLGMQKLVLIDFGISTYYEETLIKNICGSPHYVAPELYDGKFSFKSDVWALGITIYLMLYGYYPYNATTYDELKRKITMAAPNYLSHSLSNMPSHEAVNFIQKLLNKNPDERPTIAEAMEHPWLQKDWESYYSRIYNSKLLHTDNKANGKWKDTKYTIRKSIVTEATSVQSTQRSNSSCILS